MIPKQTRTFRRQAGFTLVELLLVIAIMAVLATMSLALMRSATNDAKTSATLSRISAIEAMLQAELENYEVRRLPVRIADSVSGANERLIVKNLRRRVLADMINAEIPRPKLGQPFVVNGKLNFQNNPDLGVFPTTEKSSVVFPTSLALFGDNGIVAFSDWLQSNGYSPLNNSLRSAPPSGVQNWLRFNANPPPPFSPPPPIPDLTKFDLPGEFLYQFLLRIDQEGSTGIEVLGNQAVGDSDNDGFFEVVDAWGNPLQMQILQLNLTEASPEVWQEPAVIDWNKLDPDSGLDLDGDNSRSYEELFLTGWPIGYTPLNPGVPVSINHIRFRIISTTGILAE